MKLQLSLSCMTALGLSLLCSSCIRGLRVEMRQPVDRLAAVGSNAFEEASSKAVKAPWTDGNHVKILVNGDEIFPSMLGDIKSAQKSITFETYLFIKGEMASQFVSAFCERARAGVKVHVILDSVGALNMGDSNYQQMVKAGVDVRLYHPLNLRNLLRFNVRDHRKIMVVDGRIGYTGGCGVADFWMGDAQSPAHWRETHYRLTGPVVAQLQRNFNQNWVKCGGEKLSGNHFYPDLKRTGTMKAQAYNASPIEKNYAIPYIYRQAIASARKNIIIKNSYIFFDRAMMKAVIDARKRGVHVEIIFAWEHTDAWPLRHLSIYQYHKLLKAGVHIYEYRPSMIHCKVMVIDDLLCIIGSANIDPRSLYINDESNVNILDHNFAKKQLDIITKDKLSSQRVLKPPFFWNPVTIPSRAAVTVISPQL
ncbi:MAG: phosphatidylserine/phosphatidylglycerophosphate/cardiolipin synthase family protein [Akkermansiaceae bacterium]|nr:phosphatidylserine/phosphatidylglycerophosphate/cardiolipin synthase family protein [Akkermansiaceae bacterium]